ncbi:SUMF1/EgtB/PvdO family nonheme iron enzyme [Synechococcus sp. PCC 7336]|uniref:formylglycine-generating enzyme family protein n=1 Tax=Synechococcus sp. PCC 7336 TaxID=195250 RepID=UPI00034DCCB6|nr:SUMF1/EgtB/PvdO family nonheme iron enzyme [Synechococcus sp. PCC 7336]
MFTSLLRHRTFTLGLVCAIGLLCSQCDRVAQSQADFDRAECEASGEFAWVEAGEFIAGSDRAERDYGYRISAEGASDDPERIAAIEQRLRQSRWFEWEEERQVRSLAAVCMGRNLVANADYKEFLEATGHRLPGISEPEYREQGFLVHPYSEVERFLWKGGEYPSGERRHPVVLVSYEDAVAYAQWRGDRDGASYRLPTAAEWEKAARGTDERYFPWGSEWRAGATNAAPSGIWHTSEVGAFELSRSPYGVEDMAGNVFEYTSTLEQRRGRTVSVMKGCSWDDSIGFCRAAYRHTRPIESRHILFGFRLVRDR